ncbi:MAG: ABC transporter ATP-binding protein [Thermomicrobiales bacterium]|nr:ABC transporter ATP-binding protein [Thermomicrobiales bacterium]
MEVRDLTVGFGGVTALDGVTLAVRPGARHGILGPNGSGKTTLFNAVTGFVRPRAGRIVFAGADITGLPAHRRARLGLARTFQITSLFPSLSARANVAMAAREKLGVSGDPWRPAAAHAAAEERAAGLLADLGLRHLAERTVGSLGYGEQRELEIAVALALEPTLLLLDEPTAGLSVAETGALVELVRQLPAALTVVLIEHDLGVVFGLTDRLSVLLNGVLIADGPTAEVREDARVKDAYLGR